MRFALALVLVTLCVAAADAGPLRHRRPSRTQTVTAQASHTQIQFTPTGPAITTETSSLTVSDGSDALDEVNARRAARGLRPYLRCPLLTEAAGRCAGFRAAHLIEGHTSNDFSFVTGTSATAAGCAAWPQHLGFGACAMYENHTFAGAAWVIGRDGRRYCQLFVR